MTILFLLLLLIKLVSGGDDAASIIPLYRELLVSPPPVYIPKQPEKVSTSGLLNTVKTKLKLLTSSEQENKKLGAQIKERFIRTLTDDGANLIETSCINFPYCKSKPPPIMMAKSPGYVNDETIPPPH